jgi:selenocysteine lyase/cysteine desulfurase
VSIRAREFPLVSEATYLNFAASAPLPARSAEALRAYVAGRQRLYHLYQAGAQDYDAAPLRALLARLLHAEPASIGFVPTTCDGVSDALNGVDWRPGDNVVVAANEYPAVIYACEWLARRGVAVRKVAMPDGHLDPDRLLAAVDGRTRVVAASHVHWQTGHRIDLARLGRACAELGVLTVIDAIQSVGAQPIDVTAARVDVLAAGAYKWLLGIPGAAILYVSPRALEAVLPDRAGWIGMRTSVHAEPRLEWAPDATRFTVGGPADPALLVMERSVELLLEVGIDAIARHTGELVERIAEGAAALGLQVYSRREPGHRSSIVNIGTGDPERDSALVEALAAERVIVARRGPGIRVAPHYVTTVQDVDRLLGLLGRLAGTRGKPFPIAGAPTS